jgi:hypothetical protein
MGRLYPDRIYRIFRINFFEMQKANILLILLILSNLSLGF